MSRPSRTDEAKVRLRQFYDQHGGMPSILAFAESMGYRSTSSAHDVIKVFITQGYLTQDERGGRLLPGSGFVRPANAGPDNPEELAAALPSGAALTVFLVGTDDLTGEDVLAGDGLVLAALSTGLSNTLLARREAGWPSHRRNKVAGEPRGSSWPSFAPTPPPDSLTTLTCRLKTSTWLYRTS